MLFGCSVFRSGRWIPLKTRDLRKYLAFPSWRSHASRCFVIALASPPRVQAHQIPFSSPGQFQPTIGR